MMILREKDFECEIVVFEERENKKKRRVFCLLGKRRELLTLALGSKNFLPQKIE